MRCVANLTVAAVDGFGTEPRGLCDSASAVVADRHSRLEALETEVIAGPCRHQRQCVPREAAPPVRAADPVGEVALRLGGVDAAQADGADHPSRGRLVDSQVGIVAVAPGSFGVTDPGDGVSEGVGRRQAEPAGDVRLPAAGHERGRVVDLPGAQDHDTVGQMRKSPAHRIRQSLEVRDGAPFRFFITPASFAGLPPW